MVDCHDTDLRGFVHIVCYAIEFARCWWRVAGLEHVAHPRNVLVGNCLRDDNSQYPKLCVAHVGNAVYEIHHGFNVFLLGPACHGIIGLSVFVGGDTSESNNWSRLDTYGDVHDHPFWREDSRTANTR